MSDSPMLTEKALEAAAIALNSGWHGPEHPCSTNPCDECRDDALRAIEAFLVAQDSLADAVIGPMVTGLGITETTPRGDAMLSRTASAVVAALLGPEHREGEAG